MRKFEIIDHTADVGLAATGADLGELFANAALGMFSIIGDPAKVAPAEAREVQAAAEEVSSLLATFLGELLYLFEVGHFMVHDARVQSISDTEVVATVRGEPIRPEHDLTTEIKAVTRHGLNVEKQNDAWRATVLFDI